MTIMNNCFYIDEKSIRCCYPYEDEEKITSYGVLEKYIGRKYTREEIDQIIAELIMSHPYIEGSMRLHITIMRNRSFYHILDFRNYDYGKQKRGNPEVKYEVPYERKTYENILEKDIDYDR